LTDRQVIEWKQTKGEKKWVKAIYNREKDTFTGIYSSGYMVEDVSIYTIGMIMAQEIGWKSCNVWRHFKTLTGESILRLDIS
jgi:hypothetical protein